MSDSVMGKLRDGILKRDEIVLGREVGSPNPRRTIDKVELRQLAEDIGDRGLLYPLVVWRTQHKGKPMNVLIDGNRRLMALELNWEDKKSIEYQKKGIPVRLFEGAELDARIVAIASNIQRADLSSYELAEEMTTLHESGLQQKEIARKLHKSTPWVSRAITTYEGGTPSLKEAWKMSKITSEQAYVIAQIRDTTEQDKQVAAIVVVRGETTTEGKPTVRARGKARQMVRRKPSQVERTPLTELRRLHELGKDAPKGKRYVRGVADGLAFALSLIGTEEFEKEWLNYTHEKNTEANERKLRAA